MTKRNYSKNGNHVFEKQDICSEHLLDTWIKVGNIGLLSGWMLKKDVTLPLKCRYHAITLTFWKLICVFQWVCFCVSHVRFFLEAARWDIEQENGKAQTAESSVSISNVLIIFSFVPLHLQSSMDPQVQLCLSLSWFFQFRCKVSAHIYWLLNSQYYHVLKLFSKYYCNKYRHIFIYIILYILYLTAQLIFVFWCCWYCL